MATIKSYKTAVFKIHNPSNRKKAILKNMMLKAHIAYSHTLKCWLPTEQQVQELLDQSEKDQQTFLRNQGKEIDKDIRHKFPKLSNSCKYGVKADVVAQIKSFVKLHKDQAQKSRTGKPGIPTTQSISTQHQDFIEYSIYKDFVYAIDLDTENTLRDKTALLRKQGNIRPAEIPKSCKDTGFLFLHCPDTNKYYAYINTHTAKCRFARPANIQIPLTILSGEKKGTVLPFKNGKTINSKTGILVPLAFGHDFQYDHFIAKGTAKTAKLVHISERHGKPVDTYELHIAFEFIAEEIEPETYLGVDRGIYNLASLTVIDTDGQILDKQNIDGKALRDIQKSRLADTKKQQKSGKIVRDKTRKAIADEVVHKTVNTIIAMAQKHKSQIVLENLKNLTSQAPRPKGKPRSNFRKVFTRQQYSKLEQILKYKCKLYGLPKPCCIHPAYTSQLCPKCGTIDKENRPKTPVGDGFKMDVFQCVQCAYQANADLNASRNIALKGYFYKDKYEKKDSDSPDDKKNKFTDFVKSFTI